MLTLASETRSGIDLVSLSSRVEQERVTRRYTSTQEDAWSLMAAHALMESLSEPKLAVDGEVISGPLFRGLDEDSLAIAPMTIENRGDRPIEVGVTVRGVPATPEPAGGNYYSLKRSYYTLDGEPADLATVEQGARLVAVLDVTTTESQGARLVLDDPLPAGFEIDNPHVLSGGDVAALDWLNLVNNPAHVEFRADRFVAAWDLPTERHDAVPVRLHRPRRIARDVPAPGGADRGHVPARAAGEDGHRQGRGGRAAAGRADDAARLRRECASLPPCGGGSGRGDR